MASPVSTNVKACPVSASRTSDQQRKTCLAAPCLNLSDPQIDGSPLVKIYKLRRGPFVWTAHGRVTPSSTFGALTAKMVMWRLINLPFGPQITMGSNLCPCGECYLFVGVPRAKVNHLRSDLEQVSQAIQREENRAAKLCLFVRLPLFGWLFSLRKPKEQIPKREKPKGPIPKNQNQHQKQSILVPFPQKETPREGFIDTETSMRRFDGFKRRASCRGSASR